MTVQLTDEHVRMLAEQDRDMDSGRQAFVMNKGQRWAMIPEAMEHFGLVSGQSASDAVIMAVLRFNLEHCQHKIAEKKTAEAIAKAQSS